MVTEFKKEPWKFVVRFFSILWAIASVAIPFLYGSWSSLKARVESNEKNIAVIGAKLDLIINLIESNINNKEHEKKYKK